MKNNSLINDFLARYITCLTLGRQNYYVADIANIKDKIKRSSVTRHAKAIDSIKDSKKVFLDNSDILSFNPDFSKLKISDIPLPFKSATVFRNDKHVISKKLDDHDYLSSVFSIHQFHYRLDGNKLHLYLYHFEEGSPIVCIEWIYETSELIADEFILLFAKTMVSILENESCTRNEGYKIPTIKKYGRKISEVDNFIFSKNKNNKRFNYLFNNAVEWGHRWSVAGHYRKIEGVGKDHSGNKCLNGYCWVKDHIKGSGEYVNKVSINV